MRIRRTTTRSAFTIVEMMVSMALILFIMAVIAQVFGSASKTYTALRVAGQLQARARTGSTVIRRDLTTEHFDGPFIPGRSGPRVGDQRLDLAGWVPPSIGYFEIRQFGEINDPNPPNQPIASVAVLYEPGGATAPAIADGEGLVSSRAVNHVMRFTSKLPDVGATELYCASAPGYQLNAKGDVIATDRRVTSFPSGQPLVYSRWAEIQYFLVANGQNTPLTANGGSLPLYSLRRRIRVLAPAGVSYDNVDPTLASNTVLQYPELAMTFVQSTNFPGKAILRVLGPDDVTNPANRMQYKSPVQRPGVGVTGDDILITDVLSFEVKAAWLRNAKFNNLDNPNQNGVVGLYGSSPASQPLFNVTNGVTANSDAPFDIIPQCVLNNSGGPSGYLGQRVFDTWFNSSSSDTRDWNNASAQNNGLLAPGTVQPPLRINVRAVQIKIRVWDPKAEQARQITLAQEI